MNDQSPDLDLSTLADATRGPISRRTVLAGSAFAVPAIVLTAGTPALAASGLSLAFDRPSYFGNGCSTIPRAQVSAKEGTSLKAGVVVTVLLADGYTFSTGGTSFTGTTGQSGALTLPDINVPATGTSSMVRATSIDASATTASLSGTQSTQPAYFDGSSHLAVGVPEGSTPVCSATFLTTDGRFINGVDGSVQATNVDSYGQAFYAGGGVSQPLRKRDGTSTYLNNSGEHPTVGVPTGSTPVCSASFLTSDGRLINGVDGSTQMLNVGAFGQAFWAGGAATQPFKKRDGSFTYFDGVEHAAIGVPAGSTPVCSASFLTSDGRLINGVDGSIQLSNVDSFGQAFYGGGNGASQPFKKRDGSFTYLNSSGEHPAVGVPAGSVPVCSASFLAPDGRLINGIDGSVQITNVAAYGQAFYAGSGSTQPFTLKKTTC